MIPGWIEAADITCLEIDAALGAAVGPLRLRRLAGHLSLIVRASAFSLAASSTNEAQEIEGLTRTVAAAQAVWVVVPLGFSRTREVLLGEPMPIPPGPEVLDGAIARLRRLRRALGCPVLLENFVHFFPSVADGSEVALFREVCRTTDTRVALDLTALLVNARNHGFEPTRWLHALTYDLVSQIRVGGYRGVPPRQLDDSDQPPAPEVLALGADVVARAPLRALVVASTHALASRARCRAVTGHLRSIMMPRYGVPPRCPA